MPVFATVVMPASVGTASTAALAITVAAFFLAAATISGVIAPLAFIALSAVRALLGALRAFLIIVLALVLVLAIAAGTGVDRPSAPPRVAVSGAVG